MLDRNLGRFKGGFWRKIKKIPEALYKMSLNYRKLRYYKYQLLEDVYIDTGFLFGKCFSNSFFEINNGGLLIIRKGYAWDGVTCFPDFKFLLFPSLIHDCLYQLIRMRVISRSLFKRKSDKLFMNLILKNSGSLYKDLIAIFLYKCLCVFGWVGLIGNK